MILRVAAPLRGRRDEGFTLIELLVVMIILGILAAIAIPVFLSQKAKAHDAGVKADVSNLGKEVATYFIGGGTNLALTYTTGTITLTDGGYTATARLTVTSVPPSGSGAYSHLDDPLLWCVALTDPQGTGATFRYSQRNGLEQGVCT